MAEHIITVEITLVVDSLGTKQAFRFATRGFSSKPTDTPPNAVFDARVIDAGEYRRELFSGARVTGLSRPAFGSITLSNHDGALDAWMAYGVSGAPVAVRLGPVGGNFPADFTTVFMAYAKTPTVDFGSVTIPLEDRSVIFDRPIATEVFTGAEAFVVGSPTRKKPLVFGEPGFIPLVLVDPTLLIYFVQANAVNASFLGGARLAYDGGVPLTFAGFYATPADGVANAPAPGTFKVWADNGTAAPAGTYPNSVGPCYIRLGSSPTFDLRFGAQGLLLETQADPIRHWTFPDLARRAGALDVNAGTLAPGSYPATVGNFYIDGDQTYAEVMTDSAQATFSAYGFDRLDRFFTFDLRDPDADAGEALAYTFTTHNAKNFRRQAVPGQEKPVRQVNVSAGRTWPGSVAGAATPQDREAFSREPWQLQFTITSDDVLLAHPGAISVDVQVQGAVNATDADKLAWGKKYIELYGGLRELITLECTQFDAATIGIELGSKVQVRMPRFLCAAGRNFRVVTQTINLRSRTVTFGLWGGSTGPSDAVLGGGSGTRLPAVADGFFLSRIPEPRMFSAIAVQSVALVALKSILAPRMRSIVEGGSPITGPTGSFDPDSWSPTGDPHWSDVIFLNYLEGTPGALMAGGDQSDYNQIFTCFSRYTDVGPVQGATWANCTTEYSNPSDSYYPGTEGAIGTQDWTFEMVVDANASQPGNAILMSGSDFSGSWWGSGFYVLHLTNSGAPSNVSFWAHNFNAASPLLVSTTDIRGAGPVHVAVSRSGNNWYLAIDGAIEDTATWSGSLDGGTRRYRRLRGQINGDVPERFLGKYDTVRETVGTGRYTADFTPPWTSGSISPLAPLTTLLSLQFDGTDAATTTTDSSVYAWTVTLSGGAELDTAQQYSGTASLLCNGSGARAVVSGTGSYLQSPGPNLVFYVRPASVSNCVLMTKGDAAGFTFKLSVVSGKVKLDNNGLGSLASVTASGAPSLTAGVWSKVAVRYVDPGTLFGTIEVSVDDVVGGTLPWTVGSGNVPNAASLTIGADYDGSSAFNGHIDAVTVEL